MSGRRRRCGRGAVRLKRVDGPAVLENGSWLTRSVRGRGLGRRALRLVLGEAAARGARTVRADTSAGNEAAVSLLRGLGFAFSRGDAPGRVVAGLPVRGDDGPRTARAPGQ